MSGSFPGRDSSACKAREPGSLSGVQKARWGHDRWAERGWEGGSPCWVRRKDEFRRVLYAVLTRANCILKTTGNQTLLSHEIERIRHTLERRQKQLCRGRAVWRRKVGGGTARKTVEEKRSVWEQRQQEGRADWQMVGKWSDKSLCLRGQKAKGNRKTQIPREFFPCGVSFWGEKEQQAWGGKTRNLFNFLYARYDFTYFFIFQIQLTYIIALVFRCTPQWWDLSGWSLSRKIILKQVVLRLSLGHPDGCVRNAGGKSNCEQQERLQAEAIHFGAGNAKTSEMRVYTKKKPPTARSADG